METFRTTAIAAVSSLLFAACARPQNQSAHTPVGDSSTDTALTAEQHAAIAHATEVNEGGGIRFSPEVQRLCPGVRPPNFGFNSAELRHEWEEALRSLAACMKDGGLRQQGLVLTGHTDPRGSEDYNLALASKRAQAVKDVLCSFGVAPERLSTDSRGEADARGTDEPSWALDRRADIDLRRNPNHAL